ncbi:MAG: MYG1 family protein [Peptostreptococcaceae bacterium]
MKKMAVHNGVFHADDVFGVALMQSIYEDLEIIRTRDESKLQECDIVSDVGNGKYDHHHVDKTKRENGIPYCGFGLLWKDFGLAYVNKQFPELTDKKEQDGVVEKVDTIFIQQIDAQDNGVDVMTSQVPVMTLCDIINSFVPFNEGEDKLEEAFFEAVAFAKTILFKTTKKYVDNYGNYRMVKEQLEKQNIEESHILVLEKSVPWKDTVLELDVREDVLFVVYQDVTGSWCTQTVPKEANSFVARKNLPKSWGGKRDEELSQLTGIKECIFCHPALFICGNQTKEGAIAMAEIAVQNK